MVRWRFQRLDLPPVNWVNPPRCLTVAITRRSADGLLPARKEGRNTRAGPRGRPALNSTTRTAVATRLRACWVIGPFFQKFNIAEPIRTLAAMLSLPGRLSSALG